MKNSKPTIYDPNFLPTNIYSGVPTFLNLPVLENKQDLAQMDVAVMGVPWEAAAPSADILPAPMAPSPSARHPSGTPAICPILTWTASPS